MAKGHSGRVVIEVDPALKRALYGALATNDSTLKEWFIGQANKYLSIKDNESSERAASK